MKILITGGAGFIGSHLCDTFVKDGHDVLCVDNLMTGKIENINHLFKYDNFKFMNHNVRFYLDIDFHPDQIYHLACPASPVHYQNQSLETLLTCIEGSNNILKFAKDNNSKILLTSTSEVYGDPEISPQNENYWGHVNPVGIRSCYDEGKRVSETLFIEYNKTYNVEIRIARIFNTYGPRLNENDGRVVSNFITQALTNSPITIYGNGSQTRSLCYVDDQVNGLIKLMNSNSYVGPINIGNPNEMTMSMLAEIVIKLTNSSSQIMYCPLPSDDPKKRNPDISKAKKYLDWEPKIDIEEGLKQTIQYFKNRSN